MLVLRFVHFDRSPSTAESRQKQRRAFDELIKAGVDAAKLERLPLKSFKLQRALRSIRREARAVERQKGPAAARCVDKAICSIYRMAWSKKLKKYVSPEFEECRSHLLAAARALDPLQPDPIEDDPVAARAERRALRPAVDVVPWANNKARQSSKFAGDVLVQVYREIRRDVQHRRHRDFESERGIDAETSRLTCSFVRTHFPAFFSELTSEMVRKRVELRNLKRAKKR